MRTSYFMLVVGLLTAGSIAAIAAVQSPIASNPTHPEWSASNRNETVYRGSGRREILAFPGSDRLITES